MAATFEQAVQELGLGQMERRLKTERTDGATLKVKLADGEPGLAKFRSVIQAENLPNLRAWFTSKNSRQRRSTPDEEESFSPIVALVEEFSRQDEVAKKCDGRFVLPLERIGEWEDSAYGLRRWETFSLAQRVEGQVRLRSSEELFEIVHDVWAGLCFLHQERVNIPHGNLKLSNVLFSEGHDGKRRHRLTDMMLKPEEDYQEIKIQDFQNLGIMIAQLCECRADIQDWSEAEGCVRRGKWEALGRNEPAWKKICFQLLGRESYRDFDPESARMEWLKPVAPRSSGMQPTPLPIAIKDSARSSLFTDKIRQSQKAIALGEWMAAISELCRLYKGARESNNAPQVTEALRTLSQAVESIPNSESSPQAIASLQEAAKSDCGPAAFRLGRMAMQSNAQEARTYFAKASELGVKQAFVEIGNLFWTGGPGLSPDPSRAAESYRLAIQEMDSAEAKLRLAILILKGDLPQKPEKAVDYLQDAATSQVPGAKTLLGHCYASGHGVAQDFSRAHNLFQDAWRDSEDTDTPDYTALYNLAVCIAHGLGTDTDLPKALRYMDLAEKNGHTGSMRQLERLPKRIYMFS